MPTITTEMVQTPRVPVPGTGRAAEDAIGTCAYRDVCKLCQSPRPNMTCPGHRKET